MRAIESIEFDWEEQIVTFTTEDEIDFVAEIVAECGDSIIANYEDDDRWYAIEITRLPDGYWYSKCSEDKTFGVSSQDEYIVRCIDNAGSLQWEENDDEEEEYAVEAEDETPDATDHR